MKTNIPLTELNRILQTKSSPEIIVALLNEAEEKYSPTPKHWKDVYKRQGEYKSPLPIPVSLR